MRTQTAVACILAATAAVHFRARPASGAKCQGMGKYAGGVLGKPWAIVGEHGALELRMPWHDEADKDS